MPLFNFERGYNFCNTFLSPEMIFLRKTGVILSRLLKCDREYSGSLAIMRWVLDTGDSVTLSTTIYNYLQISTTIYNYRCISGDFWLSITFRSLRSLRTPPRSAADLPPHRKQHSNNFGQKTFHRSSVPICRNIYYLLVLMNETFC